MRKRAIFFGIVVAVIALIILAPVTIVSWEYTNSDAFCTNACHQVHPEESQSHKLLSRHREVACVECHIGRMDFFDSLWDKVGHTSHAWAMLIGYERPVHSKSLQAADKSCIRCHTADSHPKNTLHTVERFAEDKKNSSQATHLVMRLHGRQFGRETSLGLDWHTSGAISYWSSDPQQTQIHKVVATLPDGTQRTYTDIRAEAATVNGQAVERELDCLGCHNRVGHPFPGPDKILDDLFANGTLPRTLPYLKQELMNLYRQNTQPVEDRPARERLRDDIRQILAQHTREAQEKPSASPGLSAERLDQLEELVEAWIVSAINLRSHEMDWQNFPSHTGHTKSPGCLRCHSGRLQTEDKQIIPVNCTTCHSIPLVMKGRRIPPYFLEQLDLRKPRDHRDETYLAIHMDQDTESCDRCHGAIDYGEDDKSHCSNSGCHGREWKYLDLEAVRAALAPAEAGQ
jgi:hypothetical protein